MIMKWKNNNNKKNKTTLITFMLLCRQLIPSLPGPVHYFGKIKPTQLCVYTIHSTSIVLTQHS